MQNREKRAAAALRLLERSKADDDQDGFDLLASVIASESLFDSYVDDNGRAYASMHEFVVDLGVETDEPINGTRPTACVTPPDRIDELIEEVTRQVSALAGR